MGAGMNNLRNDLILAFEQDNFLQVVYKNSLSECDNGNDVAEELVRIHNEGLIDVIACFRLLKNHSDSSYDFFLTRDILEKALPHLNAPVKEVMECVIHLFNEAGQDMAAGTTLTPFIDFCAAAPDRPKESLRQIETSTDQLADLLTPTIVAGTRIDLSNYLKEAIRLTEHEDIEIRKRAIFSLGTIQYHQDVNLGETALVCLELAVIKETDDLLLGNLIKSAFNLYKNDNSKSERISDLINSALSHGSDYALHAASELFGFHFNELPENLVDILLNHLKRVKSQNKGTLKYVDYGLIKLINQEDPAKGIELLETFLIAGSEDISMEIFESVIRGLLKNKDVFKKIMTRWFLLGDRALCKGIRAVVFKVPNDNIELDIDPSEMISMDFVHIVFLARKAVGYLFLKPVTAASVIISLMRHTNEENTLHQLLMLLFDPLLLNFPGKLKDYLIRQAENETGKAKSTIKIALKYFDEYMDGLKSTGIIPELCPSQAQREAHRRHFSRLMSETFKKAEQKSVLLPLVSKSVLLYGRKSINYIYDDNGKSNRMEIPLHSHGTRMEIPLCQDIDPFGLDYMLRIFKVEQQM
jgi:hypothetical protein